MSEKGLFGGMGDADEDDGGSLFSAFKPAPKPKFTNTPPPQAAPAPRAAAAPLPVPPPAPPAVPPPPAPRQPAPPDMSSYFQQRINDLEKRLLETQEKALMFSLELKNREELQRRSVNQAEELFEKLNHNQKSAAQEQKMAERLGQLEDISRRLENRAAGAAGTAGAAAAEIGPLKSSMGVMGDKVYDLESKISSLESRLNELLTKGDLSWKMAAREDALLRERLERLERNTPSLDYIDKRLSGFEMDSLAIRKVEGMTDTMARRLGKLEGVSEALQQEQVKVNEFVARESSILEELRAKFASMSAIFEHIRKLIIK